MAEPKLHKTNPRALIGRSVVIKPRHVERLFPQNPEYYLRTQAQIVAADSRGGAASLPERRGVLRDVGQTRLRATAARLPIRHADRRRSTERVAV